MRQREFLRQAAQSAEQAVQQLAGEPHSVRALFACELFGPLLPRCPATCAKARARYAALRKADPQSLYKRLRAADVVKFLAALWDGLAQAHYAGPGIARIASALIEVGTDARTLGRLPYAFSSVNCGWPTVPLAAARASEQLAAAALRLDPENQAALRLYADQDFLARINRGRSRKVRCAPVPDVGDAARVRQIRSVIARFEAGHHPLDIPSLDPITVASAPVVDALTAGLRSREWRAAERCALALGRAQCEHARVVAALCAALDDPHLTETISLVLCEQLRSRAAPALPALQRTALRLLRTMKQRDTTDYRALSPLSAVLQLARYCRGARRDAVREFVETLLAQLRRMPAWKRGRLDSIRQESAAVLAQIKRRA